MSNCGGTFDLSTKQQKISELKKQTESPSFWDNLPLATKVQQQIKSLSGWVNEWQSIYSQIQDCLLLQELADEENDSNTLQEVLDTLPSIEKKLQNLEFKKMLSHSEDPLPAIINIHPGAGGTESQDWAEMLMRMYLRYAEKSNLSVNLIHLEPGDEAGIKSVSIEINSEYAYGYLKSEIGVHRLVRISPFDSNARRHTSFAAVEVYPIMEDVDYHIDEKDITVDTYRASGAGGQHVNKTDSAVRMRHIPTGIVVTCQSERSQHKNRNNALKLLKAKVYQKIKQEKEIANKEKSPEKLKIEWGSQIRSYVFHPYSRIKDLRTEHETSNVKAVMDGDLDEFIQTFLLKQSH